MPVLQKKKAKIVKDVISNWQNDGMVSESEAEKLNNSIEIITFDWIGLTRNDI